MTLYDPSGPFPAAEEPLAFEPLGGQTPHRQIPHLVVRSPSSRPPRQKDIGRSPQHHPPTHGGTPCIRHPSADQPELQKTRPHLTGNLRKCRKTTRRPRIVEPVYHLFNRAEDVIPVRGIQRRLEDDPPCPLRCQLELGVFDHRAFAQAVVFLRFDVSLGDPIAYRDVSQCEGVTLPHRGNHDEAPAKSSGSPGCCSAIAHPPGLIFGAYNQLGPIG